MCEMRCSNPNLDLVNINACTKFGKILSFCSQDVERKQNYERILTSMNSIIQMHEKSFVTIPTQMLSISVHIQNLVKFYQFVLKIFIRN